MPLLRALIQGEPGSGKTGSIASLADEGYRIVLADFDGNPEPLQYFTKRPELVHTVPFVDELSSTGIDAKDSISVVSRVSAIRRFTKFLTVGNETLGKPKEWGPDTVFVMDSLSALADSAERLALKLNNNITRDGAHIGILAREVEDALRMFMNPAWHCHRICIAHLKLISPRPDSSYGDETALQKQIKRERADLEETGYFPNLPGVQVARTVARMFSTALLYEINSKNALTIRTKAIKGFTVKVPCVVDDNLPIVSGLSTIMKAMGCSPSVA